MEWFRNRFGDFYTPEKYIPPSGAKGIFEVCHTMNESFGFSAHDKKWRSIKDTIHMLVDTVSKGGNLLLNIGPDSKGQIPDACVQILKETGKWVKKYRDSIYETTSSPFSRY